MPFIFCLVFLLNVLSLYSLCAEKCLRVHFHLPYKWEVFDGDTWTDLRHMEDIERAFCDPSQTQRSEVAPLLSLENELLTVR